MYRSGWRATRRQGPAARTPLPAPARTGTVPILWMLGEADALARLDEAFALRDRMPDQVRLTVVPGAGHALVPEQPEAVCGVMLAFLREHAMTAAFGPTPAEGEGQDRPR
jgi:pimeloyl-ACP methyl ester carboxylesterase